CSDTTREQLHLRPGRRFARRLPLPSCGSRRIRWGPLSRTGPFSFPRTPGITRCGLISFDPRKASLDPNRAVGRYYLMAMMLRPALGELRAEEHDHGGVIDPDEKHDQRTRGT